VAAIRKNRQFPTAYKLKATKLAEGGEGVLPVARRLGISRKLLHDWIKARKAHGPEGLNRKRGPKPGPRKLKPLQPESNKRSALAQANARIAELERLVGRQPLGYVIVGGLPVSPLLTLFATPGVCIYMDCLGGWSRRSRAPSAITGT